MSQYEYWSLAISTIQVIAVITGFVLAVLQLARMRTDSKNTIELAARENAMKLIARYQDQEFSKRRAQLHADQGGEGKFYEIAYLLNFFEEISVAVKHATVNEALLEEYFSTILRLWLEKEFVVACLTSARKEDSAVFENILWLYRRWQENRDMRLRIDELPELR